MYDLKVEQKKVPDPTRQSQGGTPGVRGGANEQVLPNLTNTAKFSLLRLPLRFLKGDLITKEHLNSRLERELQLRQVESVLERQLREEQQRILNRREHHVDRDAKVIQLSAERLIRQRNEIVVAELLKRVKNILRDAGLDEKEIGLGITPERLLSLLTALTPQEQQIYFQLLGLQMPQGGPSL